MSILSKLLKKKGKDLTKERDDRCKPIAYKVIDMIASYPEENKLLLEGDHEKVVKAYTPLVESILTLMLEEKVRSNEVDYIFRLSRQPIEVVTEMVATSLNKSIDKATDALWNKPSEEITLEDIDEVLVKDFYNREDVTK